MPFYFKVNIVGVVAGVMGTRMLPGSFFTLLCVSGQAVISTIVVYLSYRCLGGGGHPELAKGLIGPISSLEKL